jgi:Ca-activated chloride channel family protein
MTTTNSGFTVSVAQNKHLSRQDRQMDAVITVSAAGLGHRPGNSYSGPTAAEVILVDCSGSMGYPRSKINAAKHATRAAIDVLRDGVWFAVVQGRNNAQVVYPRERRLVAASATTRAEAKAAVQRLDSGGGTAIGSWLTLADELLGGYPTAIRHAMLFTDGKNEWETPDQLQQVLDTIHGRFTCDARGIGDAWEPKELSRIVTALNGKADGVVRLEDMAEDFRALMRDVMRKAVPDVDLRVRMLGNARLRYLKQVFPTLVDLTEQLDRPDEMTVQVATGSWADETREYQLGIEVDAMGRPANMDTLAARVELEIRRTGETGDEMVKPGLVLVHWTDDRDLSSPIDPRVASTVEQQRLSDAVRDGCEAYSKEEWPAAETHLGLAVRLATELGNAEILKRLSVFVDVIDAAAGKVRLRTGVGMSELLALEISSTLSSRHADNPVVPAATEAPLGPPQTCSNCARENDVDAKVCEQCGRPLGDDGSASVPGQVS